MDLKISELLGMQRELQDKYEAKWGGTPPERGALQLLWGIGEIGEVIDILLRDERFLCCNRDIAINMDQIAQVEGGDFLLKNGERAPIRHRGKSALKKTYLEYSLQTLRRKEGTL